MMYRYSLSVNITDQSDVIDMTFIIVPFSQKTPSLYLKPMMALKGNYRSVCFPGLMKKKGPLLSVHI